MCFLYAYSDLSFTANATLAQASTTQFHTLRDYMLKHAEARAILAAIGGGRSTLRCEVTPFNGQRILSKQNDVVHLIVC